MNAHDWLNALTPEERAEYEDALRHTYAYQIAEFGEAAHGCLAVVFEPWVALLARVIVAARRAQGRGR